jgi:hypothetical protein
MPETEFVATVVHDWTGQAEPAPEVRAPVPRRKKPGPKPKPRKKPRTPRAGRALPVQLRTLFIDRMEEALEVGVIDLNPEDMACEGLLLTHGELELLLKILFPNEPERAERLDELRAVLARNAKPRNRPGVAQEQRSPAAG